MAHQFYLKKHNRKHRTLSIQMRFRIREVCLLFLFAFSAFFLITLLSYQQTDPAWTYSGRMETVINWGGKIGAWMADLSFALLGYSAYLLPFIISSVSISACYITHEKDVPLIDWVYKSLGWIVIVLSTASLAHVFIPQNLDTTFQNGGIIGYVLGNTSSYLLNYGGASLFLMTCWLGGLTLVFGISWFRLALKLLRLSIFCFKKIWSLRFPLQAKPPVFGPNLVVPLVEMKPVVVSHDFHTEIKSDLEITELTHATRPSRKDGITVIQALPSLSLLNDAPITSEKAFNSLSLADLSLLVESRLADFNVDAKVVNALPGPIITRFELDLAPGIKVSKVSGLAKDIARSLSAVSVRIVEIIPGKSVIGLEIPNEHRELVTLQAILQSSRYQSAKSPVSIVLGKDISGNPVVVDLAKMPHFLVAGTTGSGKSVSLNAILLSMLFKATPDQLRFILIDPKMLELSIYDGIPHLLTPVITDMKEAANALRWCVAEMDKRYKLMAALGVRNLAGYNQKIAEARERSEPLFLPTALVTDEASAKVELSSLPLIVVIIDELADMMMVVGKKVEELIARIAQKARAAGIHLILATQRPSVDVITGLIKANIPTRVAFQVSSRIDSRTILDQQGAEQLLGNGDMLYLPPGAGVPVRVHGAYVADEEVHRVVAAWRKHGEPEYVFAVTHDHIDVMEHGGDFGGGEHDPLYDEAVQIVLESKKASISLIQRRLRIGYNRAARLMETMEAAHLVSTMDANGSRELLISSAE